MEIIWLNIDVFLCGKPIRDYMPFINILVESDLTIDLLIRIKLSIVVWSTLYSIDCIMKVIIYSSNLL